MICRACNHDGLEDFVDLGVQPASNDYLIQPGAQTFYPLKMVVCPACGLGQLTETVDPAAIFSDYLYFSSVAATWVADRKALADRMINEFDLGAADLVIDIGSNDGYYLKHFLGTCDVMGYEPAANVAKVAEQAGVSTHVGFFGPQCAIPHNAALINATNVLAHTPDMDGMVAGIAGHLAPQGVATLEFPLFSNLIRNNQLDTIYHEHYSYISIAALQPVLARHGLRIWRIEELSTHGGSVRVFACKDNARFREEASPIQVINNEYFAPTYAANFELTVQKVKWDLLSFLADVRLEGPIIGYGAPAKATVLCNYAGLNADTIEYVIDDSPAKQGRYVPGTNIPILSSEALDDPTPEYIIVFPWNLLEPIKAKLQQRYGPAWSDQKGYTRRPKIITAIPELTVTDL